MRREASVSVIAVLLVLSCTPSSPPAQQSSAATTQPTLTTHLVADSGGAVVASSSASPVPEQAPPPPKEAIPGEVLGSPLSNAPTTSSGPVADADSVIVGIRPKLKRCYETVRGKGPEIAGMVSCGLRITKEGKVAAISVTRRDRLSNELVDCIVRELKTAQFAARNDEQVIQVPVRFALPGED